MKKALTDLRDAEESGLTGAALDEYKQKVTAAGGDVRTVDVHVRRLREKIEPSPSEPKYVHTKWGVGYYFRA